MNNLLNLRHFVARAELHAKIAGVGRLKFLQELKEFRVGKTKDFQIKQLKGLRELGGSLAIYNLENVGSREESWNAGLRDKIYMHDLLLSWCKNRFDVSSVTEAHVLEGLHPHSALKRLHITSYGGICSPTWLSSNFSLTSLESIYLDNCTKWEVLPSLGQFPLLKTLHLIQLSASTEVPIMSCGDWTESENNVIFPCLEELVVRDCPKLRSFALPQCSSNDKGFHSFGCLRRVNIYNCPQLIHLPQFGEMTSLSTMSLEGVGSFPHFRLFMRALHIKGSVSVRTLDEILPLVLTYCRLYGLVKLTIASFLDLAYLPWEIFSQLLSLEMLVIVDCPRFFLPSYSYDQEIPSLLKKLVIQECGITGKQLSHLLLQLPFLYFLTIGSCPKIASFAVGGLITGNFSSSASYNHNCTIDGLLQIPSDLLNRLEYLCIEDFPDLVLLCNEGFLGFISLKTLHITGCPQFFFSIMTEKESSDSWFLLPPSIQDLMVTHMDNRLMSLMLSNLTSLSILAISRSPELTSIVLHSCTSLETFIVEKCARLSGLDGVGSLCSIKHMRIFECPSLAIPCGPSSPDEQNKDLYFLLQLEKLEIDNTSFFNTAICKSLPSLQHVVFFMAKNVRSFTEEQDRALSHLTSLHILDFCYCSDLISLPKELHRLSSVKKLSIKTCPGVLSLPEKGLPASLHELYVSNCSTELKEQCRKIKNVRCVYVDRHASKFISICKMLRLYFRNQKK
uniref:R13L1/DRL21-like LRR repeat region domain-containing protein n=2 Tax=Aegilops tauschii subsp. strangulata TaxID=200361 RepID=A0A453DSN8_AEGTS